MSHNPLTAPILCMLLLVISIPTARQFQRWQVLSQAQLDSFFPIALLGITLSTIWAACLLYEALRPPREP
ncbi:hypothetical protein [Ferrimonas pelagia]|uniref:Uncharacterized protein n=1 Tax=Ferrimonas pelagia TaxID=1177826 RepID=A0ABP9ER68_9GAMM